MTWEASTGARAGVTGTFAVSPRAPLVSPQPPGEGAEASRAGVGKSAAEHDQLHLGISPATSSHPSAHVHPSSPPPPRRPCTEADHPTHTDPIGGVSRFEYTHFDLLTARTSPDGVRYEFDHDLELRLTKVTSPQGLTWNYEYDAAGRLITETDFDDRTLTYTYDPADRLTSRRNALGEETRFERNELGQVIRKDAAGRITTYAYDMTDQLAEAIGPDDIRLTLLRDRFGRLRSETVDGRTLTYIYDEMGRRTGRTTPTGATTHGRTTPRAAAPAWWPQAARSTSPTTRQAAN